MFVDFLKDSKAFSFDTFHTMQDFIMKPDTPEPKTWRVLIEAFFGKMG